MRDALALGVIEIVAVWQTDAVLVTVSQLDDVEDGHELPEADDVDDSEPVEVLQGEGEYERVALVDTLPHTLDETETVTEFDTVELGDAESVSVTLCDIE